MPQAGGTVPQAGGPCPRPETVPQAGTDAGIPQPSYAPPWRVTLAVPLGCGMRRAVALSPGLRLVRLRPWPAGAGDRYSATRGSRCFTSVDGFRPSGRCHTSMIR